MTDTLPPCPACQSPYAYEMGPLLVCPECAHEWAAVEESSTTAEPARVVKDVNGNVLNDGDTVVVAKDLPVKGAPKPIKAGTKVKNIRLIDGVGDHDIDCKVDGFGPMQLKSSVVKKA